MSDLFDKIKAILDAFGPASPIEPVQTAERQPEPIAQLPTVNLMRPTAQEIHERLPELRQLHEKYRPLKSLLGPCDRPAAEHAITELYAHMQLPAPKFLWFESPGEATKAFMVWTLWQGMQSVIRLGKSYKEGVTPPAIFAQMHTLPHHELLLQFVAAATPTTEAEFGNRAIAIQNALDVSDLVARHDELVYNHVLRSMYDSKLGAPALVERWPSAWKKLFDRLSAVDAEIASSFERFDRIFSSFDEQDRKMLFHQAFDHEFHSLQTWRRRNGRLFFGRADRFATGNGEAIFLFLLESMHLFLDADRTAFERYREVVKHCGWWRPYRDICMMVDRPTQLSLDHLGNLHRFDEPAIVYADGFSLYALGNIEVSQHVARGEFEAADVDKERNTELRRLMVERYGAARYLQETGATVINSDECGVLYSKRMRGTDPIVMVKVTNSTPEPDGTFKEYYLRVPPNITTARDAVAWTFDMRGKDYHPQVET